MTTPAEGKKAPAFTLPDQNDTKVQLSKLQGRKVLVYFYPRADIRPVGPPQTRAIHRRGSPVYEWPVQRLKVGLATRHPPRARDRCVAFDLRDVLGGIASGIVER